MTEINAGIVQSVRDRLYKLSGEQNESLQSLFVRYALERFLYRLGKSKQSGQLILKGAFLLTLWTGLYYRTTKDLDMLVNGSDSQDRIREMFDEICSVDVEPD